MQELKGKQNVTLDGTRVNVFANIQGVDEIDAALEQFVDTHHEAILKLIEMSAKNAHANGAWIGICGELAADMELTETFLKMGIDELSVSPSFILPLREKIRSLDLSG